MRVPPTGSIGTYSVAPQIVGHPTLADVILVPLAEIGVFARSFDSCKAGACPLDLIQELVRRGDESRILRYLRSEPYILEGLWLDRASGAVVGLDPPPGLFQAGNLELLVGPSRRLYLDRYLDHIDAADAGIERALIIELFAPYTFSFDDMLFDQELGDHHAGSDAVPDFVVPGSLYVAKLPGSREWTEVITVMKFPAATHVLAVPGTCDDDESVRVALPPAEDDEPDVEWVTFIKTKMPRSHDRYRRSVDDDAVAVRFDADAVRLSHRLLLKDAQQEEAR